MSAWITMISDADASVDLQQALDEARAPSGSVGNVMRVHSLRPNTMRGHVTLYRAALHDDANTVAPWLQETIASYVSLLNGCIYSFTNHWANARHLIGDEDRADRIEAALRHNAPEQVFGEDELCVFHYAHKLTTDPSATTAEDVEAMRAHGFDDGQILEVNQIICYFNYVNRVLDGLGVTLDGDVVGYYVDPDQAEAHRYDGGPTASSGEPRP